MDTFHPLRSPVLLDNSQSFDKARFADIQSWLNGIMSIAEEERLLQSPICLSEYSCPSISRTGRQGESRSRRPSRPYKSWCLAPQHRFFDKANWMDEADKYISSTSTRKELSTWRDAYTITISQSPPSSYGTRVGSARRRRREENSPYHLISLPVCPPIDHFSSPCTPVRDRTRSSRFVYPENRPSPAMS